MLNVKPINIYNRLSTLQPARKEKNKISYWLEKLHRQENKSNNMKKSVPNAQSDYQGQESSKSPVTKGIEQHAKEQMMRIESDRQKVDEMVRKSNRSIISVSSTFPFSFFPDTIDVEESRVTFIFRQFMTSQSHSVDIKDISNVFIESGVFFATLQVVSRTFVQNDIKIGYLNKKLAVKVKDVIEGLRTFANGNIDTSHYDVKALVNKLGELHVAG